MRSFIVIVVMTYSLVSYAGEIAYITDESNVKADYVSLVSIISNPGMYDGKKIVTEGYFSFQHEDVNLYLSEEDYSYHRVTNRINLNFHDFAVKNPKKWTCIESRLSNYHGNSVTIQGVFKYMPDELFYERVLLSIEYVMVMDKK